MLAALSTTDLVALADSPANRLAHSFSLPFEQLDNRFAFAPFTLDLALSLALPYEKKRIT